MFFFRFVALSIVHRKKTWLGNPREIKRCRQNNFVDQKNCVELKTPCTHIFIMAEHTATTKQTFEKIDDFAEFLGFFEEDDEFDNQLTDALDNVSTYLL